jgi:hypothetical protein
MQEKSQHVRVLSVNGLGVAERETLIQAGVQLGPVRTVNLTDGQWVRTTTMDHIPTAEELARLETASRAARSGHARSQDAGLPSPDDRWEDLETERMLEERAFDVGEDDIQPRGVDR